MIDIDTVAATPGGWDDVVGQDRAVALLRGASGDEAIHAWLFVGPHGSGKRVAARVFAGDLLAQEHQQAGDAEAAARARTLSQAEQHPDLIVVERVGASINVEQADEIVRRASRSATEGRRKVLVLDEFHLLGERVAPKLLKSIEEPPDGTFFVILADEMPRELITIASRCIKVEFSSLSPDIVAQRLVAEGIDAERAGTAAASAGGDLGRARVLATDERLALRLAAWRDLPRRVDGTGASAATAIDDLRGAMDDAEAPLQARHAEEVAELDERIERYGQRGSGAADLEKKHKREVRRFRADELRMGLGAVAATYRDEMTVAADPSLCLGALEAIQEAAEALTFNPNEELLLIALAMRLPSLN